MVLNKWCAVTLIETSASSAWFCKPVLNLKRDSVPVNMIMAPSRLLEEGARKPQYNKVSRVGEENGVSGMELNFYGECTSAYDATKSKLLAALLLCFFFLLNMQTFPIIARPSKRILKMPSPSY